MSTQNRILEPADLADIADPLIVQVVDPAAYAAAHLPGSVQVSPAELVDGTPPASGRLPDPGRLAHLFSRIGWSADRTVVVCDDEGGGWAGRFAWTLDVIGHHNWHYLNGGVHAWAAAGMPLDTGSPEAPDPSDVRIEISRAAIAEADDVLAAIEDPNQLVWDVRSAEEYAGLRSGSARAGHIPGAVNLDWLYLKTGAETRLTPDLAELLASVGVTPDRQVITHCQTHHRSGLSYMVAKLLGFPSIRAYHGSWSEWGNRDDLPIE